MKKPITLLLALLTYASVAQYNKTYDINGNADFLQPSFVITNAQSESISLSIAYDAPGLPRTDYFIVTKHDCRGNTIYNNRIFANNSPTDGFTNMEALIETDDGGVLIAGYYYEDARHIQQPVLVKVNAAGFHVWTRIYDVNRSDIVNAEINKVSLCRVVDDAPAENYFIVASGDADYDSGNSVVTTVIKVDNAGAPLVQRKYYFPTFYRTTREYPGDIEYANSGVSIVNMYMITGYRLELSPGARLDRMFFFGIDRNANIATPGFKLVASKSIPLDQDMIYDPATQEFAVTFTHEKNGYVPGIASIMGFIRINPALATNSAKYIWHANGITHNARSISLCRNGNYTLGAGIFDVNIGIGLNNPAWLKIDNTGRPVSNLIRYNIQDDAYFGHHATTFNCLSGREEYVLVNGQKTDLRVIRTNVNGIACGATQYDPIFQSYRPEEQVYDYSYEDFRAVRRYAPKESMLDPRFRECLNNAPSYRPAVATAIAQLDNDGSEIALYPTVLSSADARLTMENNSGEALKVDLHNIAGQLIYSNNNVAIGSTEVQLNTNGSLSEGIYLLKVYDAKGSLTKTAKILITK